MGTKKNPWQFDCYTKAADDEPLFTLRGKDPSGPYLVSIWRCVRLGDFEGAIQYIKAMQLDKDVLARISTEEYEKLTEARDVAFAMTSWRETRKVASDK